MPLVINGVTYDINRASCSILMIFEKVTSEEIRRSVSSWSEWEEVWDWLYEWDNMDLYQKNQEKNRMLITLGNKHILNEEVMIDNEWKEKEMQWETENILEEDQLNQQKLEEEELWPYHLKEEMLLSNIWKRHYKRKRQFRCRTQIMRLTAGTASLV